MSFSLEYRGWSFDADLQIIQADVRLEVDGELLIDEPLCIDVGLPALLLSAERDTSPNRWADPELWQQVPFFCCGCGDPECRAFSFVVRHGDGGQLTLIEVDERPHAEWRMHGEYTVDKTEYARQVKAIGNTFLSFVDGLDYRPYYKNTVATVKELMGRLSRL